MLVALHIGPTIISLLNEPSIKLTSNDFSLYHRFVHLSILIREAFIFLIDAN